ncbi:MAG: ABC transporter permease [Actinomycetes bacterium]|jgi:spermidine/putrescine transport system permease protein|nr:ABC transporter permease [Acidimicrobiia bacterium]
MVAESVDLETRAERAESRRGLLIGLPTYLYLILFFAVPLVIVLVYSFATRTRTGSTALSDWNLDSWARVFQGPALEVSIRSLILAAVTTLLSLVLSYPFAYWIATRPARLRAILLVLVMIPFWSNFLVRTYAMKFLMGSEGPLSLISQLFGGPPVRILFTQWAVLIGLVYGYMPFMILPLYAALERMDWSLVEAARDLYASGWTAFRKVTLPLSMPGVVAGSVLVFIPALGAYVTPAILGGGRTPLLGDYIVQQFLQARNWPYGAALSMAVMVVMLIATVFYFRKGGRTL